MAKDNEFSLGHFESESFWRCAGGFCGLLKTWIWVSRMDWPKSVDLRAISKRGRLEEIDEVTQEKCVERETDLTRKDLGDARSRERMRGQPRGRCRGG